MSQRVGRPCKPYSPIGYTREENEFIYTLVKKTDNVELKNKLKYNINESKRNKKNYEKVMKKIFG